MKQPGNAVHYDGAKDEEVIVQITGIEPASTMPANPQRLHGTVVPAVYL
jgi:hypothetical protein